MAFRSRAAIGLGLGLLAGPAFAACSETKLLELPVTMEGPRPTVPVKVDGTDVKFLVDSGAFFSMIAPAAADRLKLPIVPAPADFPIYYIEGLGGSANARVVMAKTFALGRYSTTNVDFIVANAFGGDVEGVIGQNWLSSNDVEYDFGLGALRVLQPHGCGRSDLAYWAHDNVYSVMPLSLPPSGGLNRETPAGVVYVNGAAVRAEFDTGASISVMSLEAAARAGLKPGGPGVVQSGAMVGIARRPVPTWIGPVASIKIGDEEIKNTKIRFGDVGRIDTEMLLGADFFLSHRVLISNGKHAAYFTYNGGPIFDLTAGIPAPATAAATPKPGEPSAQADEEPKDADGFFRRGAAFLARQDMQRALADFDKAVELAPTEPNYLYQRALVRWQNKQPLLAMADFDAALKLKPDYIEALEDRARLRLSEKDTAGAKADIDAADRSAAQDADVRLDLGHLYWNLGPYDQAFTQFDLWIKSHTQDGRLGEALGDRCWSRAVPDKELDKALADCSRAIALSSEIAFNFNSRGLVYLRLGENDKALADYNTAVTLNPKLAFALYGRGIAELRLGKADAGKADLAAAAAIQPNLPELAKKYGIVPPA